MLRTIKQEIRIIGWDDAPFDFDSKETILFGVICRGGTQVDGVITARIKVDGNDSTEAIIKALKNSSHLKQLRIMMLDGITFGGFNVVDIEKIHESLKLPVIVFIRTNPDMEKIRKSLGKFSDHRKRFGLMEKAGKIHRFTLNVKGNKNMVYAQFVGIDPKKVERILKLTCVNSLTPEPLRIAHLIGYGLGRKQNGNVS
jgi:endonuclease V-like protein UPF0215 family